MNANSLDFDKNSSGEITKLKGDCMFRQDNVIMTCDSAYFNKVANTIDAFSRVVIRQADTLTLYADLLKYDGNTKKARLFNNIKLLNRDMVLTTENLDYDAGKRIATYIGGGKITNKDNVLTSKLGYYFANTNDAYFRKDVVLTNPDYVMKSDTLRYNSTSEIAYFYGPTNIKGKDDYIYTENGSYNTKLDKASLYKKSYYQSGAQQLRGDTLLYDQQKGIGRAYGNINFVDTAQKLTLIGNFARYEKTTENTFVTGNALLAVLVDKDSMFLHADTLRAAFEGDTIKHRVLFAYHNVRIFKSDFQAACDSLIYTYKDSTISCFKNPVLWTENTQLSADFVTILLKNRKFDKLNMYNAAFVASFEDSVKFNQIRGKNMFGFFSENKLNRLQVEGNGQSVYYVKEEENKSDYIGVNRADCSKMTLLFKNNKVDRITFINQPEATFYPLNEFPSDEKQLKGFSWQVDRQPKSKEDLFR